MERKYTKIYDLITFCQTFIAVNIVRCGLTYKVKFSILNSSKSAFLSNQQLNINLVLQKVSDLESLCL